VAKIEEGTGTVVTGTVQEGTVVILSRSFLLIIMQVSEKKTVEKTKTRTFYFQ
jgi:selenocysteine-specific translation elongation factor